MKKILISAILLLTLMISAKSQEKATRIMPGLASSHIYVDARPWTRWWWFASVIDKASVADNLGWLKNNGFGGVEIAWVYPLNRMKKDTIHYTPRQEWLSPEWSSMVAYAKHCADSLGLGCDFTFGSLWPFGDTKVPFGEAAMNMTDPSWRQDIAASWDYPKKGYVIDHLNRKAFFHYAERTGNALKPALKGSLSGLFCDSWEVETKFLSTPGFMEKFAKRYQYPLTSYRDSLYSNNEPYRSIRYDYMKLISEYVIEEFYKPFTKKSHELGAYSRAQCAGAPCDIISSYAAIDIPETEALLYEPAYANIVASAAGLAGKKVVSSETFTCLYGWPRIHHSEEQTADLKLVADALFANGVNQIIWHGKPFNPAGVDTVKFYASVHVGKSGNLAKEIPAFNRYMEKVSSYMKMGVTFSDVAVYLPTEDKWIAGELPVDKQFIWAWGEYEHRYTYLPDELKAYRPTWINGEFLKKAVYNNGRLQVGDFSFSLLYADVKYMDADALGRVAELAAQGLPVCLKQIPQEPGFHKSAVKYQQLVEKLQKCPQVKASITEFGNIKPVVTGTEKFDYWCRQTDDGLYLFFANPKSQHLTFPLEYGQSLNDKTDRYSIEINFRGKTIPVFLKFMPYQSLLLKLDNQGNVSMIDIGFTPKTPVYKVREKHGKEKWEVEPTKK
ncbi:MAG: glycosyl hydrolase [Bacteroidota bacterium]